MADCQEKTKAEDRHAADEDPLKDSDSSVSLISEDSECQFVVRRKRQRTDGMKIDGRRRQEHQKENKIFTHKTDEDTKGRQKGLEKEICVITWNVHKSLAQYDFLRNMAQCQANVVMFQETQNWHEDGTAEELGWTLPKEGKTAIAVRKKNSSFCDTVAETQDGYFLFLEVSSFSRCTCRTLGEVRLTWRNTTRR